MMWPTTGVPESNIPLEERQRRASASALSRLRLRPFPARRFGPKPRGDIPDNVILPWLLSSKRPAAFYARPHAAYLGGEHDPLWTEFRGTATRAMIRSSFGPPASSKIPISASPRRAACPRPEAELPADVTLDRLSKRRSLLEQFDRAAGHARRSTRRACIDRRRAGLLAGELGEGAFGPRSGQEVDRLRRAYGMTLFGQGCLRRGDSLRWAAVLSRSSGTSTASSTPAGTRTSINSTG